MAVNTEVQRRDDEIAAVQGRNAEIAAAIATQEQNLADLQQQLTERQDTLEKRLTSSYKSDDMGYLEVVMGAGDFSDFLNRVDMINKIAGEDQKLIDNYKHTQQTIEDELASLTAKRDELAVLESELIAAEEALLNAQAEQSAYVSSLESQMAANSDQLAQLQNEAAQIEANMNSIQSQSDSSGGYNPPPAGGTTFSVTSTAYCLTGRTATGMYAGPGIIAVDPGVIPLGSQVYVSGYGNAIAADTGGAIRGNKIDVWLPCSDAYIWGVRTVNITIY
ncbi:MAG: PcsB-like coiled-coil domain-containing protein [Thermoleophilia bacterium]